MDIIVAHILMACAILVSLRFVYYRRDLATKLYCSANILIAATWFVAHLLETFWRFST